MTPSSIERRGLLKLGGLGFTGLLLGTGIAIAAQDLLPPSPVDRGRVEDGKVKFPEWRGEAICRPLRRLPQYVGQSMTVTQRNGANTGETRLVLTANKQFAAEIDHMADCIIENKHRGRLERKDTRIFC